MSGPKKTRWEIRQERLEALRRERARKRACQVREIEEELRDLEKRLAGLQRVCGESARRVVGHVERWLQEIREGLNDDLRDAWRGLKGVRNYLERQEPRLRERAERDLRRRQRQARADRRLEAVRNRLERLGDELGAGGEGLLQLPMTWLEEAETRHGGNPGELERQLAGIERYLEERSQRIGELKREAAQRGVARRLQEELAAIGEECRSLASPGIEQRIQWFSRELDERPADESLRRQVETFRRQVNRLLEQQEQARAELTLVGEALSNALGARPDEEEDGSLVVQGEIGGVPIRARLRSDGHEIHLDTPEDGSCHRAIDALSRHLAEGGVSLGPVRVLNTGETIGNRSRLAERKSIDA